MGLVKRTTPVIDEQKPPRAFEDIVSDLTHPSAAQRREAARALASHPASAKALCGRLPDEPDLGVREHIVSALMRIASEEVVKGLIPYLDSEDVWLRNAVIETLPKMKEACRPALVELLAHPDVDVRIFAVTTLGHLGDPSSHACLVRVLVAEPDVNVCAAAVEALAEQGNGAAIPALSALAARFEGETFIAFATQVAVSRIESRTS